MALPPFADLHKLSEDDRIALMVKIARSKPGAILGCITEMDPPDKADRYIEKLKKADPKLKIMDRIERCPTQDTTTIQFMIPKEQA